MKKVNVYNILILIGILILSFGIKEYKTECLSLVKTIISSEFTFWILAVLSIGIKFMYQIKYDEIPTNKIFDIKSFKENISEIISIFTEPSTFICSLSILKGLYLDYFFTDSYLSKFNDFEKFFIFITSLYFFIYAFVELKKYCKELFVKTVEIK